MIIYFPEFYDDELVYSLLSRYHVKSGSLAYIYTAEMIYKWKHTKPDIEFLNQMTEEAYGLLTRTKNIEAVIEKHTMFPYYARFVSAEKKRLAMHSLMEQEGNLKSIINLEYRTSDNQRYLRYCPICAAEDRKQYGETYWHRIHQIKGLRICAKHKCFLQNSDVLMRRKEKPQLTAAESIVPYDSEILYCDSDRELQLARYVTEVFHSRIDINANVEIGKYLRQQLSNAYKSESKLQKYISKIFEDYRAFYKDIPEYMLLTLPQIQKIFNGDVTRCFDICQLALFEGISVKDIISPTVIDKSTNHIYQMIADRFGYDYDMVAEIGDAVLREYQKENRIQKRCGAVSLAWEQMDKELLPEVKINCLKIYKGDGGRPHKVTMQAVKKMMNLPEKRLDKLPMCKAEIMSYKESQKQYWAREVVWAYQKLLSDGVPVCWRRIREITNMRNVDFQGCKQFVNDYADAETTAAILQLL